VGEPFEHEQPSDGTTRVARDAPDLTIPAALRGRLHITLLQTGLTAAAVPNV
jgi:hypothetical protein